MDAPERSSFRPRGPTAKLAAVAAAALFASLLALVLIALGNRDEPVEDARPAAALPVELAGAVADPPVAEGATAETEAPVATAADVVGNEAGDSAPRVTPSEVSEARLLVGGMLAAGLWVTGRFEPDFSLALGKGWSARTNHSEYVGLDRRRGEHLTVIRRPRYVVDPATGELVRAPGDLLAWMRRHPCVESPGARFRTAVGGNPATAFDFAIAADPACTGTYWEVDSGLVYGFRAGERDRLLAVSVRAGGAVHELLVNVSTDDPARFDAFLAVAGKVLASAAFG